MDLERIQQALREKNLDGWLFYDFHNRDQLAYRILDLDGSKMTTRRWFYFIPADGEPQKLVHSVEPTKLDALPGKKTIYLPWEQLHAELEKILGPPKKIAMQYSPDNNIPYISIVDGGTIELIRKFGHEIVSSADLVQVFEAVIDEKGYQSHLEAGKIIQQIKDEAFAEIGKAVHGRKRVTEYDIQQFIVRRFEEENLTCENEFPIVGVNEHPANPHFEPTFENAYVIKEGDTVLIDLWAKKKEPGAIYYDITWCGFVGKNPPTKYVEIFHIVRDARNTAVRFIRDKFARGEPCFGWQVDDVCRQVVKDSGYGSYFIHRTGHSIGTKVHGNGVNIDNLETKDERQLVPGICFSIEPGIYLEGQMAVRSEVNVFITMQGEVVVAGDEQQELVLI
ncbi:aminopeptidase P family protein [candidate division KSB1 bacterium]|nr:MAG: aminopeptidase P family protein [candidate division KSB1 bacterium]RKY85833.1 MAG: aminopeptidase P family protein [candidate division KSB1 bacterium]